MSTDSTASAAATATTSGVTTNSLTGCVKWFDNGLNYGFITVLSEGENKGVDIFVHQSNIRTSRDCFRTLYTGECVQFDLTASNNEKHPYHAVNVHGFNGTLLHCENPNYRPRRAGSERGRGGHSKFTSRNGNFNGRRNLSQSQQESQSSHQSSNAFNGLDNQSTQCVEKSVNQSATNNVSAIVTNETIPAPAPAPASAPAPANTTGGKRVGGRGRGRKVSA
jgi:cold shock CspA family protein